MPAIRTTSSFGRFARSSAHAVGQPAAFVIAVCIIILWAVAGPIFNYSDTWQLVINTGTTIVTFLMVFIIQNTQNRDSKAIHLKLDELIRAQQGARDDLVSLEELSDSELQELEREFRSIRERMARRRAARHAPVEVASTETAPLEAIQRHN